MSDDTTRKRAERIALARANLQAAYDADPEATQRFHARMANLAAAKKREQERFELLVLGRDRPAPKVTRFRARRKLRTVKTPVELDPEIESALAMREASSVPAATPETVAAFNRAHRGSLAELHKNGTISSDQLAWAQEISDAAESIYGDVDVAIASLEARVDTSRHGEHAEQKLHTVRRHIAYARWREAVPVPQRRVVLDMIVDGVGYTSAAKAHRISWRRAKGALLSALDLWPACRDYARRGVSQADVDEINAALV